MKKLVIGIGVVVVIMLGAKISFEQWETNIRPIKTAQGRVESMLQTLEESKTGNNVASEQAALCLWAENKLMLDRDRIEYYEPIWLRFLASSGLKTTGGWGITSTELHSAADDEPIWVEVKLSSGGKTIVLKVPDERSPIELLKR